MAQILDAVFEDMKEADASFYFKSFIIVVLIICLAIYIGQLLFGKQSISVLINLQNSKISLQENIKNLNHANASLQREYFNYKSISE